MRKYSENPREGGRVRQNPPGKPQRRGNPGRESYRLEATVQLKVWWDTMVVMWFMSQERG